MTTHFQSCGMWSSVWQYCVVNVGSVQRFSVMSPQNALLPAGLRQKDQTAKEATGPFDRERLLKYLEKEAMEYKDREDIVPFTGEKKGELHACPALLWHVHISVLYLCQQYRR